MKKTLLVLSLLLACTVRAIAQKAAPTGKPAAATQRAGANVLRCTIDGKPYTATGGQVRCYARLSADETPPYQSIHLSNDPQSPVNYALRFYLAAGGVLAPGTYTASDRFRDDAPFPNVAFDITESGGNTGFAFESMNDGSGTVTVTSVAGGIVEGTFAFHLEGRSGKRTVTNGRFKFKMPLVEPE